MTVNELTVESEGGNLVGKIQREDSSKEAEIDVKCRYELCFLFGPRRPKKNAANTHFQRAILKKSNLLVIGNLGNRSNDTQ